MHRLRFTAALAVTSLVLGSAYTDTGDLPHTKLAQMGKAATALVECDRGPRRAHGSAFCVHPSGLFVTNEHVVRDATAIRLVLNPSLDSQKVVTARVVRLDRERDLALLRTVDVKGLPALELGSTEGLSELQEIVAAGFPFGRALVVRGSGYPAVSINKGTITSLRRLKGELHRIQVDAVLNPGNSGGPVLDRKGKVIGVVVAGVVGAGVNFVIPVSYLTRMAEQPEIEFNPPQVKAEDRHKPVAFEARVVSLVPPSKPLELDLTLTSGGATRRVPMKREGAVYRAQAIPVPASKGPTRLRIELTYADATVRAVVLDRAFKVGDREVRLADVKTITPGPKPRVELHDGKVIEGALPRPAELRVLLGEAAVALPLASAKSATLSPPDAEGSVELAVVARHGERIVGKASSILTLFAPAPFRPAGGASVVAPKLEAARVTRALPAAAADAVLGGGGRYLILHLPKLRRLAIFDVTTTKLAGLIPVGSDNVQFAAGLEKLVIALPEDNVIQRWDLATRSRELSAPFTLNAKTARVAMGHSAHGPILVTSGEAFRGSATFLDLKTLQPMPITLTGRLSCFGGEASPVRASGDGRVFSSWRTATSPQGIETLILEGNRAKVGYSHDSVGHVVLGDDGRHLFTGQDGVLPTEGRPTLPGGGGRRAELFTVPAARGPFYLGFRVSGHDADSKDVSVHLVGDKRPLLKLRDIAWPPGLSKWGRERFAADRRIWFLPEAKLLITIPDGLDKLVLHQLDVEDALQKSDIDFLLVTSRPPASATRGRAFSYQLAVKSKKGGVKYELSSGPTGMELSKTGLVRWNVPAAFKESSVDVIVAVSDSAGQEVFHSFKLRVD